MVSYGKGELQTVDQECAIHANTSSKDHGTREKDTERERPDDSFSKSRKQAAVTAITDCS
jgi:hypothetical protein